MSTEAPAPRFAVVITVLVLATCVSIMSTDMYVPSLPHLTDYFGTSAQMVKLTITVNLIAFGVGQLIQGPLSDRFGRRPVLLAGLLFFTVFSLACALAQTIGQLLVARIFLGLAASVEAVVGLAVLRDLFDEERRVRALAIWGMAIAVAPAVAPIIGGYVHVALGWQANFYIVAVVGFGAAVAAWFMLPESTVPDRDGIRLRPLARAYGRLLRDRSFLGHSLMLGAGLGAIYAFITAAPFILIDRHGVATEHFGYYQAAVVAAFFVSSWLAQRLVGKVALPTLLVGGLIITGIGAVTLPWLHYAGNLDPITLTVAMCGVTFGMGPIFAISPSKALDGVTARIGAASALLSSVETGIGALAAAALTVFHDGTEGPFALTMIALVMVGALGGRLALGRARPGPGGGAAAPSP